MRILIVSDKLKRIFIDNGNNFLGIYRTKDIDDLSGYFRVDLLVVDDSVRRDMINFLKKDIDPASFVDLSDTEYDGLRDRKLKIHYEQIRVEE